MQALCEGKIISELLHFKKKKKVLNGFRKHGIQVKWTTFG